MSQQLQFRVSSALKNIIGKELITDKYIAIFELVKNSFDAYAERVDVSILEDKIIIKDDGKGMNIEDITNKWLFVGYSAKADNTENRGYKDYRNKIKTRHAFAGAKGVGRFACDRLGKKLELITIKEEENPKIEKITIQWDLFEEDSKADFIDINVSHKTLKENPYPEIKHGTILEISELREEWKQLDKFKLERQIQRLINPMQDNTSGLFEIYLNNKKVENFVFEKLDKKTTQITIDISKNGEFVTTELKDRGELIYKIKEKNIFENSLFDIKIVLFYMSPPIKRYFLKEVGTPTNEFGNVFLYKNGFRVYPFGEPNQDNFGIDKRKAQGYARYLGTRELFGRIEINNTSNDFKESSSRDGGLLETKSYQDLKLFFLNFGIKRFESYIIQTLDWVYSRQLDKEFSPEEKEKEIKKLIEKLTGSKEFIELEYSYSLPEKIEEKSNNGFQGATEKLKREAKKTGNKSLEKEVKKIEKTVSQTQEKLKNTEKKIKRKEEQVSALKSFTNKNLENLESYHHQIGIISGVIKDYIHHSFNALKKEKYSLLEEYLQIIQKENGRINTISRFATGSGMKEKASKEDRSLNTVIINYLQNDYIPVASDSMNISLKNNTLGDFIIPFSIFDISLILDNLLDNAKKAKAKNCEIILNGNNSYLEVSIIDDGIGINKKFKGNIQEIFELKVSSTNGAGIGLFNVKEVLKESFSANISVKENKKNGSTFILTFTK